MLRLTFLLLLAVAGAGPARAAAWQVEAEAGACVMAATYAFAPGVPARLAFAISADHRSLHVATWRSDFTLDAGAEHAVTVRVNDLDPVAAVARVLEPRLFAVRLRAAPEIVAALMTGRELRPRTARTTLSFTLAGVGGAMRDLLACALDGGRPAAAAPPGDAARRQRPLRLSPPPAERPRLRPARGPGGHCLAGGGRTGPVGVARLTPRAGPSPAPRPAPPSAPSRRRAPGPRCCRPWRGGTRPRG